MRRSITHLALALAVAGLAGSASAQTVVAADVVVDTTWGGAANPSPIILQQPIFVRSGATLTILPGTIVRGQPRSGPVVPGVIAGTPGTLVVTQTGRIIANGNALSPIIMTTAAVDNDGDGVADDDDVNGFEDAWVPGDVFLDDTPATAPLAPLNADGESNVALWGGLVVLGNAPTNNANKCPTPYGTCNVEGLSVPGFPVSQTTYGGLDPNDNSGILRYVSVRHAGDEIGNGNELNGITLGGVGTGTLIQFVEVYANFDDGVEWFGGTASGSYIHVLFVGDDAIDVDEGYTGVNQFVFVVAPFFNENDGTAYGSASGDKLGELDGDNWRPDNAALNDNVNQRLSGDATTLDATPWPLSSFQFWNVTGIGATPDAGQNFTPVSSVGTKRGLQFRNGSAGSAFHSIIVNTGAETGIEVTLGATGFPGFDAIDNVNNGLINLVCSTLDDGAALAAQETTAITNGNTLADRLGGTPPASNNVVNSALFPGLENEDVTIDPQGNAGKLDCTLKAGLDGICGTADDVKINPRPKFGLTGIVGCPAVETDKVTPVTYRGAFDRTAPQLWTTDWTVLSIADLIVD